MRNRNGNFRQKPQIPVLWEQEFRRIPTAITMVNGIQKMASRKGYKVNLYDRCAGLLSDSPAASTVIVVGSESSRTPHILQDLKKAQWQIVVTNVDADHIDAHYSCATFSRRIITEQMLDHLLNKGCRRIAMVGLGQRSFNDMVHQDAMAQYLLKYPYAEGACFEYQNRIDESFNAFYAMRDGFDAVLCPNAFVAVAFLHFCEEKGIVVPNDLLVACMKDHSIGRYCKPSLTSLAVDFLLLASNPLSCGNTCRKRATNAFVCALPSRDM